jgi:DNA (cytosine-5)-methyltransferase 1
MSKIKPLKIAGQFSGVGAFDHAFKRIGVPFINVYQAEWDSHARKTYLLNNECPEYYVEDVYDTPIEEITEKHGSMDVFMSSTPCQSFSMMGKRQGKDDEKGRGILFFQSLKFIGINKPRFFIFENVEGLVSHEKTDKNAEYGRTFSEWVNYLGGKSVNGAPTLFPYPGAVNYHLHYEILNAKEHGIPQNRKRIFLVGVRDDHDNDFYFPKTEHLQIKLKDVLEKDIPEKYYLS